MVQIVEMTHDKKIEMYKGIKKDKLIEMLIESNNVIEKLTKNGNKLYEFKTVTQEERNKYRNPNMPYLL